MDQAVVGGRGAARGRAAVMKHVRFAAMAEGFVRETVGAWPALRSAEGRDVLFNAVLPLVGGTKVVPRLGFGPRVIYLVGGDGGGGAKLRTMELYDPQNVSWTQRAAMAGPHSSHGCAALDGKLYAVGGFEPSSQGLDTAEVYDPQTDGWQPLAKMSTARYAFGLAAVGGKIYAIGGSTDGDAQDSVEAYDPQLGSWALVASMGAKRKYHASVVLDGKIYTMGGAGNSMVSLDMVEVYDPQADSWQLLASMPQGLDSHTATAMGGKIYVTGGLGVQEDDDDDDHDDNVELNLVYVYDPRADAWTQLASMGNVRQVHASAAVGGKLYVFGGLSASKFLSAAEVYDPASNSWAQVTSLTSARGNMVAVTL